MKTIITSLLVGLYFLIGTGVFISINTRTAIRCPGEDHTRAIIYGLAWPMLLGYRILDGNMQNIPNCKMSFPNSGDSK